MKKYESRVDMGARRRIAEAQLGLLRFHGPSNAYCQCPGVQFHTGKPGKRDCRVALEGVPTIHCLHTSCLGAVQEANKRLRSEVAKAELVRTGGDISRGRSSAPPGSKRKLKMIRVIRSDEAFSWAASETPETFKSSTTHAPPGACV